MSELMKFVSQYYRWSYEIGRSNMVSEDTNDNTAIFSLMHQQTCLLNSYLKTEWGDYIQIRKSGDSILPQESLHKSKKSARPNTMAYFPQTTFIGTVINWR